MLLRGNDLVVFGIIRYGAELCIDDIESEAGLREAKAQARACGKRSMLSLLRGHKKSQGPW